MLKPDARKSGSFKIGGEIEIHRLGFGAMRVTGPGIWGPPVDRAEAIRTLQRLPELGVDFIDTADSYGPEVSERLIREALYPYDGMLIATKGGLRRPRAGVWERDGRPEYLCQQALTSRERLGLEQIALWQLHSIDPKVPRRDQFAAVKSLLDDGIIRHAGLSNVSIADLEAQVAREQGIEHIVMGTRGLGSIQGLLLGSVAIKVIHLARRDRALDLKDVSIDTGVVL
jgi:aryl-alcohol dehydrogenase-like predicted oxidoreductase